MVSKYIWYVCIAYVLYAVLNCSASVYLCVCMKAYGLSDNVMIFKEITIYAMYKVLHMCNVLMLPLAKVIC